MQARHRRELLRDIGVVTALGTIAGSAAATVGSHDEADAESADGFDVSGVQSESDHVSVGQVGATRTLDGESRRVFDLEDFTVELDGGDPESASVGAVSLDDEVAAHAESAVAAMASGEMDGGEVAAETHDVPEFVATDLQQTDADAIAQLETEMNNCDGGIEGLVEERLTEPENPGIVALLFDIVDLICCLRNATTFIGVALCFARFVLPVVF